MGKLSLEKFEGGTFAFRSRFDEAINWSASDCSANELAAEYGANVGSLQFHNGVAPIGFNCRWPTRKDLSVARKLAGIEIEAKEDTETGEKNAVFTTNDDRDSLGQDFIAMELAVEVARVCLETVSDWDDWPAESGQMLIGETHEIGPASVPVVKVGVVPDQVLEDIGLYLIAGSQPSASEKKPSEPLPFGN